MRPRNLLRALAGVLFVNTLNRPMPITDRGQPARVLFG